MKILLLEDISSSLAKDVIGQLSALKKNEPIEVSIFSYGGDVLAGNAIIHALQETGSHITTNVIGVAASMASVISQIGNVRLISPNARFNIHNGEMMPQGRLTKEAHIEAAALLEAMDMQMTKAFAKSSLSTDELQELMAKDIILTAEEALDMGFFDDYSEPVAIAATLNNINTYNDMTKLESIMRQVRLRAKALGFRAELTDDEALRLAALEAIVEPTEEEATELAALKEKASAEIVAAEGDPAETGAEILTSEMVTREEFDTYKADMNALMEQVLAAIEIVPSEEAMVEEVAVQTTAKLDRVLKAIKTKTTIPVAAQNFKQPVEPKKQGITPAFLNAKVKELKTKNGH